MKNKKPTHKSRLFQEELLNKLNTYILAQLKRKEKENTQIEQATITI